MKQKKNSLLIWAYFLVLCALSVNTYASKDGVESTITKTCKDSENQLVNLTIYKIRDGHKTFDMIFIDSGYLDDAQILEQHQSNGETRYKIGLEEPVDYEMKPLNLTCK